DRLQPDPHPQTGCSLANRPQTPQYAIPTTEPQQKKRLILYVFQRTARAIFGNAGRPCRARRNAAPVAGASRGTSAGVNDQLFLDEKPQRAVAFHVNRVHEIAFDRRKHGDHRASVVVIGSVIDHFANRKLRHREFLLESMQFFYKLVNVS
ncbi:MAG TPA: hypothetical protein VK804_20360, partial [Bradyrhizobium sp.]|uniref:hypothetical protein n=1 Tax=Bradyrhizobium sp. TaxID=376 RepID=UPI002C524F3A